MRDQTYGSLCTGIGGLDLAVEAHFGAEMVWCAEWEQHLDPIIQRHFGPVLNLRDLTTVSWDELEPVDILTAGYPCQPFSHAGKRQGADDERHLWPHIIDAVRVLRPRWVVLENVAGHLSLGFDTVLADLAEAGFDAEWCLLRASDVGAPHQRARVFVVAADADRVAGSPGGAQQGRPSQVGQPGKVSGAERLHRLHAPANPSRERHGGGQEPRLVGRLDRGAEGEARERQRPREIAGDRSPTPAADADNPGREGAVTGTFGDYGRGGERPAIRRQDSRIIWGQYAPAIARWEHVLGRPAPRPTDENGRLSPRFVEWMMGYPEGWVDGLTRTQALKALGNAVVPQQGYAALRELAPVMEQAA